MRSRLLVLIAGALLAVAASAGPAWAGGGTLPVPGQSQSADQSQTASNEVDQSAHSSSTAVNLAPNVAVLNVGSPCGCKGSGGTDQSSAADAGSSATNVSTGSQSNDQSQTADQSQSGRSQGDPSQSADQSQTASNEVDQSAKSSAVSANLSPNVAVANGGPVDQSSKADADSSATNVSTGSQSNDQSQTADQTQSAGGRGDDGHDGCGCDGGKDGKDGQGGPAQSADQTQTASNTVDQTAKSKAVAVNLSPNVAVLDWGPVHQSSKADADSSATNVSTGSQSNDQSQTADQKQRGGESWKNDGGSQTADQSQTASNTVDQTAKSKAVAVNLSPNVAVLDWGPVHQSSKADADSSATNVSTGSQSNDQSQTADQKQRGGESWKNDGGSQTADQTQTASNTVDQTAKSKAVAVNLSPNVAVLDWGPVHQSSKADADSSATNVSTGSQSNDQSQTAGQTERNGGNCHKPPCKPQPCKPKPCRPKPKPCQPCKPTPPRCGVEAGCGQGSCDR